MKRFANYTELEGPKLDNTVNLSAHPLDYLKFRFKAVIKREMDQLLKIKKVDNDPSNIFLSDDLGVPAGSLKPGLLFSQKVFLIGSSLNSQVIHHFHQNFNDQSKVKSINNY